MLAYATRSSTNTSAIFAVRADGTEPRQLTGGDSLDIPTVWSPDGSRLTFERFDPTGTYSSVFTVGLDGAPPVEIGGSPYDEEPAWSPDGRWVAYQEQTDYGSGGGRADTTFDLWVSHPDGSGLTRLGSGGVDGSSADWVGEGRGWKWSPDATRIAFVQPDAGLTDPATGDSLERLAVADVAAGRDIVRVGPLWSPEANGGWAWSPDGRRLGFIPADGAHVAVLDLAAGHVTGSHLVAGRSTLFARELVPLSWFNVGWDWSPGGKLLGIVQPDPSHRDRHTGRVPLRLAIVDPSGRRADWVIPGLVSTRSFAGWSLATADTGWTWSPDGTRIALLRSARGSSAMEVLIADVRHRTVREIGRSIEPPIWSPDGRALTVTTPRPGTPACGTLRIVDPATGRPFVVVPHVASACDEVLAWSPDGSLLAFVRSNDAGDTTFTIGRAGSPLRQAATEPSPADSLQWPAQCAAFFRLGDDWLVADSAGRQHLVAHPSSGAANWAVLRCS